MPALIVLGFMPNLLRFLRVTPPRASRPSRRHDAIGSQPLLGPVVPRTGLSSPAILASVVYSGAGLGRAVVFRLVAPWLAPTLTSRRHDYQDHRHARQRTAGRQELASTDKTSTSATAAS